MKKKKQYSISHAKVAGMASAGKSARTIAAELGLPKWGARVVRRSLRTKEDQVYIPRRSPKKKSKAYVGAKRVAAGLIDGSTPKLRRQIDALVAELRRRNVDCLTIDMASGEARVEQTVPRVTILSFPKADE